MAGILDVFTAVGGFLLGGFWETYKASIGYEAKQKEIRFSKYHDKLASAVEGLAIRIDRVLAETEFLVHHLEYDAVDAPQWSPRSGIADREESDQETEKRQNAFIDALDELTEFHSYNGIYLSDDVNERILGISRWTPEICERFINRRVKPLDMTLALNHNPVDAYDEASEELNKVGELRNELVKKFRSIVIVEDGNVPPVGAMIVSWRYPWIRWVRVRVSPIDPKSATFHQGEGKP